MTTEQLQALEEAAKAAKLAGYDEAGMFEKEVLPNGHVEIDGFYRAIHGCGYSNGISAAYVESKTLAQHFALSDPESVTWIINELRVTRKALEMACIDRGSNMSCQDWIDDARNQIADSTALPDPQLEV